MLAISDDRFANPNAQLKCKTYKEMVDVVQSLADKCKEPVHIRQDILWLADQIRMRYRLEPVGLLGNTNAPRLVLGTGYVPQVMIWFGSRQTTKGKTLEQYNLHSMNLDVQKGEANIIRSGDVKTLARRLKVDMFELIDPTCDFITPGEIDGVVAYSVDIGGQKDYVPYMDDLVRRDVFYYLRNKDTELPPSVDEWVKQKSALMDANDKLLKREEFIRTSFCKRAVAVAKIPMVAEYNYFFQEVEYSPIEKRFVCASERVFFSDIADLADKYPHIFAVNNMLRMKNANIFNTSLGFSKEFNFINLVAGSDILDTSCTRVLFPAERIPSEFEMLGAQEVKTNIAAESVLSILNF
jgi:hypothetical protein